MTWMDGLTRGLGQVAFLLVVLCLSIHALTFVPGFDVRHFAVTWPAPILAGMLCLLSLASFHFQPRPARPPSQGLWNRLTQPLRAEETYRGRVFDAIPFFSKLFLACVAVIVVLTMIITAVILQAVISPSDVPRLGYRVGSLFAVLIASWPAIWFLQVRPALRRQALEAEQSVAK